MTKDFKEYRRIEEFSGCALRIMPTAFGKVRTPYTDHAVDVLYANVTILWPGDKTQDVGNIPIFARTLIGQIRSWYDGRPITGTLRKRHVADTRLRGMPPVWILDDVEVG